MNLDLEGGLKGNPRTIKLKEQAFQINGPKFFNCLLQKVRNQTGQTRKQDLYSPGAEDFKYKLDMHLETVPDQPRIDGMSPGIETNSILHQSKRGPGGICCPPLGPRAGPQGPPMSEDKVLTLVLF